MKAGKNHKLPSQTQDFHLIRPVCALGTFPSRGRLANAFSFFVSWFFDRLKNSSDSFRGVFDASAYYLLSSK